VLPLNLFVAKSVEFKEGIVSQSLLIGGFLPFTHSIHCQRSPVIVLEVHHFDSSITKHALRNN
jgi:hypothetical protein